MVSEASIPEVGYFITHSKPGAEGREEAGEVMRNRKVQRALRKMKEDKISLRNESYAVDFTPHDAVEKIVEEEKKQIIRAVLQDQKQAVRGSVLKQGGDST